MFVIENSYSVLYREFYYVHHVLKSHFDEEGNTVDHYNVVRVMIVLNRADTFLHRIIFKNEGLKWIEACNGAVDICIPKLSLKIYLSAVYGVSLRILMRSVTTPRWIRTVPFVYTWIILKGQHLKMFYHYSHTKPLFHFQLPYYHNQLKNFQSCCWLFCGASSYTKH